MAKRVLCSEQGMVLKRLKQGASVLGAKPLQCVKVGDEWPKCVVPTLFLSLNFIRLLRVVITPSVGENDSKQSDEFQANYFFPKIKDIYPGRTGEAEN